MERDGTVGVERHFDGRCFPDSFSAGLYEEVPAPGAPLLARHLWDPCRFHGQLCSCGKSENGLSTDCHVSCTTQKPLGLPCSRGECLERRAGGLDSVRKFNLRRESIVSLHAFPGLPPDDTFLQETRGWSCERWLCVVHDTKSSGFALGWRGALGERLLGTVGNLSRSTGTGWGNGVIQRFGFRTEARRVPGFRTDPTDVTPPAGSQEGA